MFFSLNKKIIYTIACFFMFTAGLFIYTFYEVYGTKIQEEQRSVFARNQQFVELLYDYINLKSDFKKISREHPEINLKKYNFETSLEINRETLSREQKRAAEMVQNYNERYQTVKEAVKMVAFSSILIVLSMFLLWLLIRRWVIAPINTLSSVSDKVSSGILSSRININENQSFFDEFDTLSKTFNQMLDTIESNIIEIKNKEIFLQSLIDNIPDGIRVIDDKGKIRIANKEYLSQIDNKKSKASLYNSFKQHLAVNKASFKLDKHAYTVESIRDLSEDINFSHQQKLSSLGFLGTSIAHEMKNHLGSVRMITEGLLSKFYKKKPYNEEAKKYLELINKQIVECINVPERLLKLALFSQEEMSTIDCTVCTKEVVALLDYEAKRNGISINLHSDKDAKITGLEADFKMIILNLAQNSFKAMKSGGELDINISKTTRTVTIVVTDNGKGIPENKLDKIFEPFYSEDGIGGKKTGTGLGLSIVRSIVEKFGGKIVVKSKLGVGTSFSLKFPLQK